MDAVRVGLVGAGPWAELFTAPMLGHGPACSLAVVWARRQAERLTDAVAWCRAGRGVPRPGVVQRPVATSRTRRAAVSAALRAMSTGSVAAAASRLPGGSSGERG